MYSDRSSRGMDKRGKDNASKNDWTSSTAYLLSSHNDEWEGGHDKENRNLHVAMIVLVVSFIVNSWLFERAGWCYDIYMVELSLLLP